tara:strand:+ start:158 stop:331 length:174 start_codon:yes stop_codon:yes gene_type:complete
MKAIKNQLKQSITANCHKLKNSFLLKLKRRQTNNLLQRGTKNEGRKSKAGAKIPSMV